jgi:hypothetical protein
MRVSLNETRAFVYPGKCEKPSFLILCPEADTRQISASCD